MRLILNLHSSCLLQSEHVQQLKKFNVGEDCPVFDGVFEFCQIYTGGSVGGAVKLNHKDSDIVVNWMGGLHHAKKVRIQNQCFIDECIWGAIEGTGQWILHKLHVSFTRHLVTRGHMEHRGIFYAQNIFLALLGMQMWPNRIPKRFYRCVFFWINATYECFAW